MKALSAVILTKSIVCCVIFLSARFIRSTFLEVCLLHQHRVSWRCSAVISQLVKKVNRFPYQPHHLNGSIEPCFYMFSIECYTFLRQNLQNCFRLGWHFSTSNHIRKIQSNASIALWQRCTVTVRWSHTKFIFNVLLVLQCCFNVVLCKYDLMP